MEVKYKLIHPVDGEVVIVSMKAKTADSVEKLLYEGKNEAVQEVQRVISQSAGIYGHLLGEKTSVLDLDVAMRSDNLAVYSPNLIEGEIPKERSVFVRRPPLSAEVQT